MRHRIYEYSERTHPWSLLLVHLSARGSVGGTPVTVVVVGRAIGVVVVVRPVATKRCVRHMGEYKMKKNLRVRVVVTRGAVPSVARAPVVALYTSIDA